MDIYFGPKYSGFSIFEKNIQQSVVSIYGPLGYGPSTLPLRHSAINTMVEVESMSNNGSETEEILGKNICQKWDSNPRPQKWTAT